MTCHQTSHKFDAIYNSCFEDQASGLLFMLIWSYLGLKAWVTLLRKTCCPVLAQYEHAWICMNHVQHPADTWTEDHRTLISGACGQRLCLHATPQDASYSIWLASYPKRKDPKKMVLFLDHFGARWNTKTPLLAKRNMGNTTCVLALKGQTRISALRLTTKGFHNVFQLWFVANRKRFPHLHVVSSDCKYGPWTGPASTNKRRRLHRSTPSQIKASSNWKPLEQRKKYNLAPGAKMFQTHTDLIHSFSYQICPDQAEVNFLSPRHLVPFPQTAGLKGKKRQL